MKISTEKEERLVKVKMTVIAKLEKIKENFLAEHGGFKSYSQIISDLVDLNNSKSQNKE